jgi:hypothetical protein
MDNNKYRNLRKLIDEELEIDLLKDYIAELPKVYKTAYNDTYLLYPDEQAQDLLPYVRRAKTEKLLQELGWKYNLKTEIRTNKAYNCWHAKIRSNSVVLTAHYVRNSRQKVRKAFYRDTLAEGNQLWYPPVLDLRSRGEVCYVMLLHGPELVNCHRVGFARLVIPSFDCKEELLRIDLEEYCNTKLYSNIPKEEIEDKVHVNLRRKSIIEKTQS